MHQDRRPARRGRRGNYSMIMGTVIFVILGFSALAVDISLITMSELQAQATADAASHAALVAYRNNALSPDPTVPATAAADFMVNRNAVGMGVATRDQIRFGTYDKLTDSFCVGCSPAGNVNAVEVTLSREGGNAVNLLLAPMFGVMTHDVNASAITAQQKRAMMLVQDFSCSMNFGGYPRPIDLSRSANWLFMNYLVTFRQDGDRLGLAGYARWGAMEGGGAATVGTDPPWARLSEIAIALPYLQTQFAGVCNTEIGCPDDAATMTTTATPYPTLADIGGCTNPQIAMLQAIDELTDPANGVDNTFFRGMLVMSDGEFNCGGDDAGSTAAADTAWNIHDVHIWTVLFYNGGFDQAQMQSLTRGVGFYQFSPNAVDLPVMFKSVAESLPTAIVD